MMLKFGTRLTIACLTMLSVQYLISNAASIIQPEYNTAPTLVSSAAIYYKAVHGRWPTNWAEIVASGLFSSHLELNGQSIEPDDGSLDFLGDVQYFPPQQNGLPRVAMLTFMEGQHIVMREIDSSISYDRIFDITPSEHKYRLPARTIERFKQLAIAGIANNAFEYASRNSATCPASWVEFVNSDLSPISSQAINPLTGEPWKGDGSANNFLFISDGESCFLRPVMDDGSTDFPVTLP